MPRLSATDVARHFSEVLNRVAAGEEIEITRAGAPVAVLTRPRRRYVSVGRLREIVETAPPADDNFVADLDAIRKESGVPESPWPS
jgi:prevent-host-death family protein